MVTDLARWTREFSIPWTPGWPANYPAQATTMNVQRAATACSLEYPDQLPDLLSALFHAFWADKKGVQLREVYEPIVVAILGNQPAKRVFEMVSQYSLSLMYVRI